MPSVVSTKVIPAVKSTGNTAIATTDNPLAAAAAEIPRRATSVAVSNPRPNKTPTGYICHELLGDHYDPLNKRLVLSSGNFHSRSTAVLGIAAHECGHAIQHKVGYAPLQWRMAAVGLTSFASQAVLWLPLVGMFTGILSGRTGLMIMAIAWGVIMLFNLVTLPVEYDASCRAKKVLPAMGFIREGE